MAGTIELDAGVRWSAASWIFEWVLRTAAQHVGDDRLAHDLCKIVDENIGWIALDDLQAQRRSSFIRVLQELLVPVAETELPHSISHRAAVIDHIKALAELARSTRST
jgi:hypothetical protein